MTNGQRVGHLPASLAHLWTDQRIYSPYHPSHVGQKREESIREDVVRDQSAEKIRVTWLHHKPWKSGSGGLLFKDKRFYIDIQKWCYNSMEVKTALNYLY
jgi:hypothetical protein